MPAYPQVFRLRQKFERPRVDDLAGEVHAQLARLNLAERVRPGQSVASFVSSAFPISATIPATWTPCRRCTARNCRKKRSTT